MLVTPPLLLEIPKKYSLMGRIIYFGSWFQTNMEGRKWHKQIISQKPEGKKMPESIVFLIFFF